MITIKMPEGVKQIIETLNKNGYEAFAVGGCIRDSVMGRNPHDWDITTSAKPHEVKKLFRRSVDTGIEHGTVTILLPDGAYEVTTYRIDGEYIDFRHPKEVIYASDLKEDLLRRDFTVNAIAYNDSDGVVDPYDGIGDIERKIIRCVGNATDRFMEDALRILRAIRFSAQLGFSIEDSTAEAIKKLAPLLSNISAERICAELIKTIASDSPETLLTAYEAGVTRVILPEFDAMMNTPQNTKHHFGSVGIHTIRTMQSIPADKTLRLTMLMHDIGKPQCHNRDEKGIDHFKMHAVASVHLAGDIMKRLKLDNKTIRIVSKLIRYHDWHLDPNEENVRRLVNGLGKELMEPFFLVQRADLAGQSDYRKEEKLDRIVRTEKLYKRICERGDCTNLKELAVSGMDLLEAGLPKGPAVGEALNAALNEVLKDHTLNNKEYLVGFIREHADAFLQAKKM